MRQAGCKPGQKNNPHWRIAMTVVVVREQQDRPGVYASWHDDDMPTHQLRSFGSLAEALKDPWFASLRWNAPASDADGDVLAVSEAY